MDPSPYAEQRYRDGLECARRAVQYDQEGHYSGALSFYSEAVEALNHACAMSPAFLPIKPQVEEYTRRAESLRQSLHSAGSTGTAQRGKSGDMKMRQPLIITDRSLLMYYSCNNCKLILSAIKSTDYV